MSTSIKCPTLPFSVYLCTSDHAETPEIPQDKLEYNPQKQITNMIFIASYKEKASQCATTTSPVKIDPDTSYDD